MAISEFETKRITRYIGNFVERKRPRPELRNEIDIGFRIDNQSYEIFEIRPRFGEPNELIETEVAKATYVKSRKVWKLYWMRSDLKWISYKLLPEVKNIETVLEVIEKDVHGYFWG